MIIGWALVNNSIENGVFEFSSEKVAHFKQEQLLPENARVGLGLQICVDQEYQGKDLIQVIYSSFENSVADSYDFIEASVRKGNPAGHAATTRIGFQLIYEDNLRYYKIKETPSKGDTDEPVLLTINGETIRVRLGKLGDEKGLYQLNSKWIVDAITNPTKGFLTSLYTEEEFKKIIALHDIVIAETV